MNRNRVLRGVRRVHMYTGIFLTPWVLLYGVTAALFNPPAWLNETHVQPVATVHWAGTEGEPAWLDPGEWAQALARELSTAEVLYSVPDPEGARFRGELYLRNHTDTEEHLLTISPEDGRGSVRTKAVATKSRAPFAGRVEADAFRDPFADVLARVPALLEGLELDAGAETTVRFPPRLQFVLHARENGAGSDQMPAAWWAVYDPRRGTIAGRPIERKLDVDPRRFALRMHTAHGYPNAMGARWVWAISVDLVALAMAFWGVSGLLMWWQMRTFRRSGLALIGLSIGVAVVLAVAMYVDIGSS